MTPEELQIEAKSKRATPGPWTQESYVLIAMVPGGRPNGEVISTFDSYAKPNKVQSEADCAHAAACSPDAVLRMIERLRRMETALRRLTKALRAVELPETGDEAAAREVGLAEREANEAIA